MTPILDKLLEAALAHVAFDGWSPETFTAAIADAGVSPQEATAACPRGAVDLAVAYHKRGDAIIEVTADMADRRYSEKVADLIWRRIRATDKETVRRGMALFALPQHAAEGASLIWGTADATWTALGDTSRDGNWYSKRAILSGVFASSVLFWLGDTSEDDQATRDFIDRRIANVMQFEQFKGQMRKAPLFRPMMDLADGLMSRIHAPRSGPFPDYPGWTKDGH